ncbi:hypothetical protein KFE25_008259 [Diacronema lutheri]|uniref:Ribonucleoside-diphosphate reductase n=4 Tax=Diacronema lutheri TaxID=2081491 RepID=A0A8J6CEG0_DIALT|nr:hypothetical protein KFE25_008259 [Diacronema lutheri]
MHVVKRDGTHQPVRFDKITSRIDKLCHGLDRAYVDIGLIAQKVVAGVHNGVRTSQLDDLACETAAYMTTQHPDYGKLAARLAISNLHKQTEPSFAKTVATLHSYVDPHTGEQAPLVSDETLALATEHAATLDDAIKHERDFEYDFFGFRTLERSYLLRMDGRVVERPQHMLMRVALGIHKSDLPAVLETYSLMSAKWFTMASPTMFNAGTRQPQMSSCFLLTMAGDSIDGIYETLTRCALISKSSGGVGLNVSSIRASGSYIRGTNGNSNGLVPMLRVFNNTARFVNQGGGKRRGSFAVYLEPWHADIFSFLDLRKNTGKEELRARDLFYALWVPDVFMKRVQADGAWPLFCPNECPGLADSCGPEFEALFLAYEAEGKARKTVKAQELWFAILDSQIETGTPYMLYKDACNLKSNQKHLGTIKGSNLCTEIIQYTSPDEVAVCNLASIALPMFVRHARTGAAPSEPSSTLTTPAPEFDHAELVRVAKVCVRNLNRVIDGNYYPVPEARTSNMRHRPVGLGVQGLADTFIKMRLAFESDEARTLNRDIFESIYFGALCASCELAEELGAYASYEGSPVSQGILQFDMWGVTPTDRHDWAGLRAKIATHGVRNSLLVAPMPTASTAQILGNNECFEPYTSNLYTRRVLSGEFTVVNSQLLYDLMAEGLWTAQIRNQIIAHNGSVQQIPEIPQKLKDLYKTCWEIKQRTLIDMAADRGAFIDQSQSFNVFMQEPNYGKLSSLHFYAWSKGLKTGMYYLRTKAAAEAIKFTVDQASLQSKVALDKQRSTSSVVSADAPSTPDSSNASRRGSVSADEAHAQVACSLQNRDECLSCGS